MLEEWQKNLEANAKKAGKNLEKLIKTVAALRTPGSGCPWDLGQTHLSLAKYTIEEAYEAVAAIHSMDSDQILEEYGDVLLQVVLHAQLLAEQNIGGIDKLIASIDAKMVRRHPHVFDPIHKTCSPSADELRNQWQKIKLDEKLTKPRLQEEIVSVESNFPSSLNAVKIGEMTHRQKFDWSTPDQVIAKLRSEVDELEEVLLQDPKNKQRITDELGDVYFTAAQLARHLKVDPEVVGVWANEKFMKRFNKMLTLVEKDSFSNLSNEDKEKLWEKAKKGC